MPDEKEMGKLKYNAPTFVDLSKQARGNGACSAGSGDTDTCTAGDSALTACTAGPVAHDGCTAGGAKV